MIKNARRVGRIATESGRSYLELDFWFPEIKLAFEFQVNKVIISLPLSYF